MPEEIRGKGKPKMKMKKILCVVLAAIMMLSLAACGTVIDDNPVSDNQQGEVVNPDNGGNDNDADNSNTDNQGWGYDFSSDFIDINGISYIWDQLDESIKVPFGEIMNAIANVELYCSLTTGVPNSEKEAFLTLISNCSIGYTYVENKFKTYTNDDGTIVGVSLNYNVDYEDEAHKRTKEVQDTLAKIIADMPTGSDFEKIEYLHNYLVLNCTYSENAVSPFTAYGALVEGKATCQGYADAMHLLLNAAGFTTCFATGIGENEAVTHKWNYVLLSDGNWYVIDSTWDDPEGKDDINYINYDYLLISDEVLLTDHKEKFTSTYYKTPDATSMDMNYHVVKELYAETYEQAKEILLKQAIECGKSGARYLYIRFANDDVYNEAVTKLFSGDYEMQDVLKAANKEAGSSIVTSSWYKLLREGPRTVTVTLKY